MKRILALAVLLIGCGDATETSSVHSEQNEDIPDAQPPDADTMPSCTSGDQCSGKDEEGNESQGVCDAFGQCCTACLQGNGLCRPFAVPTCGAHGNRCAICSDAQTCVAGECI